MASPRGLTLLLTASVALASGCLSVADPAESKGSGGNGGSAAVGGTSSVGGGGGSFPSCSECGATSCTCMPSAPSGWHYARELAAGSETCPVGDAALLWPKLTDPGCEACSCGSSSGGCHFEAYWMGTSCAIGPPKIDALTPATPSSCRPQGGDGVLVKLAYDSSVTCPASSTPRPTSAIAHSVVCALTSASSCGDGACAPNDPAFQHAACVLSEADGDVPCPGGYPVKRGALAAEISDTRVCGGCTCSLPPNAPVTCTAPVLPQHCSDCAGTVGCSQVTLDQCIVPGGTTDSVRLGSTSQSDMPVATGSCTPGGTASVTSGSLQASKTRTLCCTS